MQSRHTLSRLVLAAGLVFGGIGLAQANDLMPQAASQIQAGQSQDAIKAQFGEPVKSVSYLFAPGKAWFYYVQGGTLGNEHLVQVNFDAQGMVQSTQLVNATAYDLNRYE